MVSYQKKITLAAGIFTIIFLLSGFTFAQANNYARSSKYTQQVQQIRQQAQDQVRQLRNSVMDKIGQIRDQRKQNAARSITNQFDRLNQVWTDHFTNVLDKLDDLLARIKLKANSLAVRGQDIASVKIEIADAEANIAAARSAINEQAKKTYVVDVMLISEDSTTAGQNTLISQLRNQFKALRDSLSGDIKVLRDGFMKEAKQSVQDALQALSGLPDANKELAD